LFYPTSLQYVTRTTELGKEKEINKQLRKKKNPKQQQKVSQ